jgi:hypothetical protein
LPEPTSITLGWAEVIKLALGTGLTSALVTTVITLAVGWLRDARQGKKEATELASSLAVRLERFAIECGIKGTQYVILPGRGVNYGS